MNQKFKCKNVILKVVVEINIDQSWYMSTQDTCPKNYKGKGLQINFKIFCII